MKIVCPICAFVIDAGDVPDTLLSTIGSGTLTVRCPACATEIELAPLTATLHFAGSSSTWHGTATSSPKLRRRAAPG
jgi:hypothetical protein